MNAWIAFWNILAKDMRSYYLKPPNVSWGLIFSLAWTGMFFIRSGLPAEGPVCVVEVTGRSAQAGSGLDSVAGLLPGVIAVSVLFGTTSLLAVTVTFEKKGRSFERLLLAPNTASTMSNPTPVARRARAGRSNLARQSRQEAPV